MRLVVRRVQDLLSDRSEAPLLLGPRLGCREDEGRGDGQGWPGHGVMLGEGRDENRAQLGDLLEE